MTNPLSPPSFIERDAQSESYYSFLRQSSPRLLLVTGMPGCGKSFFLKHMYSKLMQKDDSKNNIPKVYPVYLDFADISLQTDPFTLLSELSQRCAEFCDAEAVDKFRQALQVSRQQLIQRYTEQLKLTSDQLQQQAPDSANLESLLSEDNKEDDRLNAVQDALLKQLATLPQDKRLVVMFDTCEWLTEPMRQRVKTWLLEQFLPNLYKQCPCHVVMACRTPMPLSETLKGQSDEIELRELEKSAAIDYTRKIDMQEEVGDRIYNITHGHPLCFSIMIKLWQEEKQEGRVITANQEQDLARLENKYSEHALAELVHERLDQRLPSPYREWTHYGILLRSFNKDMLRKVFSELPCSDEDFDHFVRFLYVQQKGAGWYTVHELLREVLFEILRRQEPDAWQLYHQRARDFYKKLPAPQSYGQYYHCIALSEFQGFKLWHNELQKVSIKRESQPFINLRFLSATDAMQRWLPVPGMIRAIVVGLQSTIDSAMRRWSSEGQALIDLLFQSATDRAMYLHSAGGQALYEDGKLLYQLQVRRKQVSEDLQKQQMVYREKGDQAAAVEVEEARHQLENPLSQRPVRPWSYRLAIFAICIAVLALPVIPFLLFYHPPVPNQVTTPADDGPGSLRDIITKTSPGSTITFSPQLQGTITLSKNLDIEKNVKVVSYDNWPITITNNHNQNVHIHIKPNVTVTFDNLTFANSLVLKQSFLENEGKLTLDHCNVQNNISYENGGGIANNGGTITIENKTTITNNFASSSGGGIYSSNNGTVAVTTSTISSNTAFENGGGIYSVTGTVTLNKTTIQKNQIVHNKLSRGGGITVRDSQLSITSSTITSNWTSGKGGGISMLGSQGTMSNSIVSSNIAANSSESSGNEMAIEQESGNQKTSSLIITGLLPKPPLSPNDIIGASILSQNSLEIDSTTSNESTNGNPASQSPPESTHNYIGNIDLGQYCQKTYTYPSFDAKNTLQPACLDTYGTPHAVDPLQVCQEQYPNHNITTDRLADYFDPASWQCYTNAKLLGTVATENNVKAFCQEQPKEEDILGIANNSRTTAYDWKCLHRGGTIGHYPIHLDNFPVGLSMGDLCQSVYGNKIAPTSTVMERLTDYNSPEGWECWELQALPTT